MTSNALIWNPLAKADRMLVYYNSSKGNLGLRQWTDGEEGWGPVWAEKEESLKGNVLVGGGLTALQWRDWVSFLPLEPIAVEPTVLTVLINEK